MREPYPALTFLDCDILVNTHFHHVSHQTRSKTQHSKCQWFDLRLVSTLAAVIKPLPPGPGPDPNLFLFPSDILPPLVFTLSSASRLCSLCWFRQSLRAKYPILLRDFLHQSSTTPFSFCRCSSLTEECHLRHLILNHIWWIS